MNARLAAYVSALQAPGVPSGALPVGMALPELSFRRQIGELGLVWRLGAVVLAHIVETGFLLASWVFIGYGALNGRLDAGWLAGWALCLVSTVPFRLAARWLEGVIGIGAGCLLKQRLLAGATRIDADLMRRRGAGALMAEVLESETIERLATSGGFESLRAGLELLVVPLAFVWGAAGGLEIGLLMAWCIILSALVAANTRRRRLWTTLRLRLTHRLVENMSAHRTRLVQKRPRDWHREEDSELRRYSEVSERLDRSTSFIEGGIARGYVIAGLAALAPSLFAGTARPAQQAIALGAVLFAASALERLSLAIPNLTGAWIAWQMMKPVFDAGGQSPDRGVAAGSSTSLNKVLQAREVTFDYQGRTEPVLQGCSLTVERGDFLLLEGDSGSGKSTFAALLAGLRKPSSGVILSGGLDRQTLGDEVWRSRLAVAPQYHENHVLSASLAFNLLLGRSYPHPPADTQEARELCMELGLGPLLERMPAGLEQIVGETGWQLSQGERSRVFLARALLQRAEMVILDESLAALDPENLQQCLKCVMRRAGTALVIAHP